MSGSLKRKRTDSDLASGSALSQISPNNWLDPQYINLQTLKNGLKRATFCFTLRLDTFNEIKKSSIPTPNTWDDFIEFELRLPECTGLNALANNDNPKTCYAPPTGKTKLNFPNIHDVTFRHNYCPASWKYMITSGSDTTAKFEYKTKDRTYMTCLLADGRDNLQELVPTSTDSDSSTFTTWDGLFDLTRYSMGDGLIEGIGETHVFGPDMTWTDVPMKDLPQYTLMMINRDQCRREFKNNFCNITKGGYQVLNDNLKLLVHDSVLKWNMDMVGVSNNDTNDMNSCFVPWTMSVQIDYEVKPVDKLLVYRQSLQQYISAKVKPEQKMVTFLDASGDDGIAVIESRFECGEKAKSVDQQKSKRKF